jgi:hypothetical protein
MKSIKAEDDISEMTASVEATLMNVTTMNRKIKDNSGSIKDLWAAIEALRSGSGAEIPMPAAPVEIKIPEGATLDANELSKLFA